MAELDVRGSGPWPLDEPRDSVGPLPPAGGSASSRGSSPESGGSNSTDRIFLESDDASRLGVGDLFRGSRRHDRLGASSEGSSSPENDNTMLDSFRPVGCPTIFNVSIPEPTSDYSLSNPVSNPSSFSFPLAFSHHGSERITPMCGFYNAKSDLDVEMSTEKSDFRMSDPGCFQPTDHSADAVRTERKIKRDAGTKSFTKRRTKSKVKFKLKHFDSFSDVHLYSCSSGLLNRSSVKFRRKFFGCRMVRSFPKCRVRKSLKARRPLKSFFSYPSNPQSGDVCQVSTNESNLNNQLYRDQPSMEFKFRNDCRFQCFFPSKVSSFNSFQKLVEPCGFYPDIGSPPTRGTVMSSSNKVRDACMVPEAFNGDEKIGLKSNAGERNVGRRTVEGCKENVRCYQPLDLVKKFLSSEREERKRNKKSQVKKGVTSRPSNALFSIDVNSTSSSSTASFIEYPRSKSAPTSLLEESSSSSSISYFTRKPLLGSIPATSNHIFGSEHHRLQLRSSRSHPSHREHPSSLSSILSSKKFLRSNSDSHSTSSPCSPSSEDLSNDRFYRILNGKLESDQRSLSNNSSSEIVFEDLPTVPKYTQYQIEELKLATDDFSESNVIGQGGYGKVYLGILPIFPKTKVAIKVLKRKSNNASRFEIDNDEFTNELDALSRLNHRNLVKLYGFCTDFEQRLLVYQFVTNGSLYDHLHGKKLLQNGPLGWNKRVKIAKDISRGISHLHFQNPLILHRDLKSSNILLTNDFRAKLADFGCAKPLKRKFSINSKGGLKEKRSVEYVQFGLGTIGHIAPELIGAGEISSSTDIFSFGVILLELLTGKKPVERDLKTPRSLISWSVPLILSKRWSEVIDPFLIHRIGIPEHRNSPLCMFARLAASCLHERPISRPSAEVIFRILSAISASDGVQRVHFTNKSDWSYLSSRNLFRDNCFADLCDSSEARSGDSSGMRMEVDDGIQSVFCVERLSNSPIPLANFSSSTFSFSKQKLDIQQKSHSPNHGALIIHLFFYSHAYLQFACLIPFRIMINSFSPTLLFNPPFDDGCCFVLNLRRVEGMSAI